MLPSTIAAWSTARPGEHQQHMGAMSDLLRTEMLLVFLVMQTSCMVTVVLLQTWNQLLYECVNTEQLHSNSTTATQLLWTLKA